VSELANIRSWPELERPVLVLGLEGWIDAGFAGTNAVTGLLGSMSHDTLATFEADDLLDHRARRPILRINDGVNSGLTWPEIRLHWATNRTGRSVLVLAGPEPDLRWRQFTSEVVQLALRLGVQMVVGLGAFPAPVPHTRPVRLASTASSHELASQVGYIPGIMDVPAGIHASLEAGFAEAGIPAVGLWARVPHYVSAMPYPAASAALLEELAKLAEIEIDTKNLQVAARQTRTQIDQLIANSEEHGDMVRQLESQDDQEVGMSATQFQKLPSGDEIAAELERFLRGDQQQ